MQEHDDFLSGSGYGSSSGQLGLPGEDPNKICPSSPSLRKVSVGSMDVKSGGGIFKKKKSIPSLVMTFNAANKFASNVQESHEAAGHKDVVQIEENLPGVLAKSLQPPHSPAQLLSVDSVMDRMETGSVASFRSGVSKTMSLHSGNYGGSGGRSAGTCKIR